MPTPLSELTKRVDMKVLYPPLVKKIEQLLLACQARGLDYYAISGLRTVKEQDELFAQGRTKPGAIVTNARGGQSGHNFGAAVDLCPDKDMLRAGLQPDWSEPSFKILGEEAAKIPGLEHGGKWKFKDLPHLQLPLDSKGVTLKMLKAEYDRGGYPQVFKFLDSKGFGA